MEHFHTLLESILVLAAIVSSSFWLKHRDIINDNSKVIFSRMTTDFVLPALIFSTLASSHISFSELRLPLIMFSASVVVLVISFLIGRSLGLNRKRLGVFMVLSAFGSSSSLGYPLIHKMFPSNAQATVDAMVIGEFGVAIPFFMLGVSILIIAGQDEKVNLRGLIKTISFFFKTPMIIALFLGVIVSLFHFPAENIIFAFVIDVTKTIGSSLIIFVSISVGLMLKPVKVKDILLLLPIIGLLKLIAQPLLTVVGSNYFAIGELEKEILLIEAAMPSGIVVSVMADRYGCDSKFAAAIVIVGHILALVTIPLITLYGV